MRVLILVMLSVILTACSVNHMPQKQQMNSMYFSGGNGSTIDQAVVFPKAQSHFEGIPLKGRWLAINYPGCKNVTTEIIKKQAKTFDKVTIVTDKGREIIVFFDSTNWRDESSKLVQL